MFLRPTPLPNHLALSIARIGFFALIAVDFLQMYLWREVSFSGAPAFVGSVALPLAILSVLLLSAGVFTRYSAIVSYVLTSIIYTYCQTPYHLDNFAEMMFFVFMFAPAPRALAFDVRRSGAPAAPSTPVPRWFFFLFFMGMEVIYADSVVFKLRSVVWRKGLAMWMPAALPHFSTGLFLDALEIAPLVRVASYLALSLELLFPLILLRRTRSLIVAVGVFLHLGIAIFFPIPLFGLGVCAAYAFFVDWGQLLRRISPALASKAGAGSEVEDVLHWTRPAVNELAPGLALAAVQLALSFAPHFGRLRQPLTFAARLVGVTRHAIYVDAHFNRTAPILRFKMQGGDAQPLATFDERGYPEVSGRYWCDINFSMRSPVSQAVRDQVIGRYVHGYLQRLHVADATLSIEGKDVRTPLRLDFKMDDTIERRPWTPLGTATVKDGKVSIAWAPKT